MALFLGADGNALTAADLRQQWQQLTSEIVTPTGDQPEIEQAQSTWCVEMLMRGLNLEAMQVLTGWEASQLAPYVRRAQEQTSLLAAFALDTAKQR
mgnify:FL=1